MSETLLRRQEVEKLIGIKCATIYQKIKKLRFPKQHKYGGIACWKMRNSRIYKYWRRGISSKTYKSKLKLPL